MNRLKVLVIILLVAICLAIAVCSLPTKESNRVDLGSLENVVFSNERFILTYKEGRYSLYDYNTIVIDSGYSEAMNSGRLYRSYEYSTYDVASTSTYDIKGSISEITITLSGQTMPTMQQKFYFYADVNYFLFKTILSGDVETNYIAPLVLEKGGFYKNDIPYDSFLDVPFDNDQWVSYDMHSLLKSGLGHEIGEFVNFKNGSGLIIGSLEHNEWKSAVEYIGAISGIGELKVYSGANTALTRDQSPHGTLSGATVGSSTFCMGFYDDWQEGLESYARLNTAFTPKRKSVISQNPIGWNSWGSVQTSLDYGTATAISQYIKDNFQDTWQDENNTIYVNLDSYWDNMSEEELKRFVRYCNDNGQQAGIYFSPFVTWHDENGINTYTLADTGILIKDLVLKKANGMPYGNDIDGCFPLDVTHPAVVNYYKTQLEKLISYGFSYVKLDFLVHGSLEGLRYDENITTGIQAYNFAMNEIVESVGENVFINLSMAPIFPYNYANGRRLACDTYYGINETQYMLNSLTYGFWQSELYDYIDPDNIVLWGKDGKAKENESKARVISGVVTGGSFLAGDNFVNPAKDVEKARDRFDELLNNSALIDVLKIGKPFQPIVDKTGTYSAEKYVLYDESGTYVALFNFDRLLTKNFVFKVGEGSAAVNLLDGSQVEYVNHVLKVTVAPSCAILIKIN